MKIGLQINRFTWPGHPEAISNTLRDIAITADTVGFYSIWLMDHFFQIGYVGKPEEPMLEAYTTLGFLAGITKKVKLGTLVTGVIYRNPGLLVKTVTTLDVLSQGRAYLGIGAAWNEEEAKALGFHFPPLKERFEKLEETLQIAQQMWSGNEKAYKGKHAQMERLLNSPQAISKPHPPIMIGGGGEKKTLYLVAKYGNACNLFAHVGKDELVRKLDILKQHCKNVGRNYSGIEKTVLKIVDPVSKAQKIIEECKNLKAIGFNHIIFSITDIHKIEPLKIFGEKIVPKISTL